MASMEGMIHSCAKCYGTKVVEVVEFKPLKPLAQFFMDGEFLTSVTKKQVPCPHCTHTCKFCGHVWAYDSPCEYSTNLMDNGTYETTFCGSQMCPMCSQCQGKEATEQMVELGQQLAAIKLGVDK